MATRMILFGAVAGAAFFAGLTHIPAQQVTVGTPFNRASDSFFERNGSGVGFAQGSRRTFVSQTPVITIPNGGGGSVSSTTQQPFVTGLIPIVGGGGGAVYNVPRPYYPPAGTTVTYPLHDKIREYYATGLHLHPANDAEDIGELGLRGEEERTDKSSAAQGDISLAEIRRNKALRDAAAEQEKQQEIDSLIQRGRGAEEAGKIGVAKIYYRQAARQATGELLQQLIGRIRGLDGN